MKKTLILGSLAALLLCSCAAIVDPGYHQKSGFTQSGYLDTRVDHDTFMVTFIGNGDLSEDECQKFALRRASEVTSHNGYEYFKVLSENMHIEESKHESSSIGSVEDFWEDNKQIFRQDVFIKKYPTIRMKIKCYNDKPRGDKVFCARDYMQYNFPHTFA